jgi:hypothetical protein
MRSLVGLIFQNDDAETNITGGDQERCACNSDESQLPAESETNDNATNKGGNTLNDCTESDTRKPIDFLWVFREVRGEGASAVLFPIEELN